MTADRPNPPADLGREGRALWRQVVADYVFRADEAALFGEMCRTVDRLAAIRKALAEAPSLVTAGSTGQARAHPLLGEERAGQLVLVRLASQLGLTDDDEALNTPAKRKAAQAANVRWMREANYGPTA